VSSTLDEITGDTGPEAEAERAVSVELAEEPEPEVPPGQVLPTAIEDERPAPGRAGRPERTGRAGRL
jgi:hypothetical protein